MKQIHIASVDGFLGDPLKVRHECLAQDFGVSREFQGLLYPGVVDVVDQSLLSEVESGLKEIHGDECKIKMAFFRLSVAGQDTPTWIHQDDECDKYAFVLCLTRPQFCEGGTAFWKHNRLGLDSYPMRCEANRLGMYRDADFVRQLNSDGQSSDAWTMTGLHQMKFNRVVTYRSNIFHSRWPRMASGTNKDDGRLILAGFYDVQ